MRANRVLILLLIPVLMLGSGAGYLILKKNQRETLERWSREISRFTDDVYGLERSVIESVPIYSDYATDKKEAVLRTHLLADHLEVGRKHGLDPAMDPDQAKREGKLVPILRNPNSLFFFYGLKKENRFLTPLARQGLEEVTRRFNENLRKRGGKAKVKLALSSAFRSESFQKRLRRENPNASVVSSHSYGASFDIFWDDYFVAVEGVYDIPLPMKDSFGKLTSRTGFLLGDALRRQFKTVLMETLIQMQKEGKLYAILERRQRCYHITILP
jgi:hypothetical protein